ncbi:YesL family protein [Candidatus Leptofilum sp.]|uniref:YesL family protein n=1 Tax=Candidatus Leptofilum sp. TaxID=3241576 RepID=UPI003B5AC11B
MFKQSDGSPSNLLELFNTLTNFILFNMLWVGGSLFVITIPAVTAALFASVAPWARGQSPDTPLITFWQATRRYWRKATVLGVIDLVLSVLIGLNLYVIWQTGFEQAIALPAFIITSLFGLFLIVANVYLWPLLVTLDQPLRSWLRNGLRLTVAHAFWGILVAAVSLIPLAIGTLFPRFIFLIASFAGSALITYWGAWYMIKRYLDEADFEALGLEIEESS